MENAENPTKSRQVNDTIMISEEEIQASAWLMDVLTKSQPISTELVLGGIRELTYEIKVPKLSMARNIERLTPDDLPLCSDIYNHIGTFYSVKKISCLSRGILNDKYLVISREAGY